MGNILTRRVPVPPREPSPKVADKERRKYPGTMEDLHKQCKEIFPVIFEGAKLLYNRNLSEHFRASHTIQMSAYKDSGYRFGAMYIGSKKMDNGDAYPILVGEMDPSGNLSANCVHTFGTHIKSKLHAQVIKGKFPVVQMSAEYQGNESSVTVVLANPSIMRGTGFGVCQYLKQVSPRVALGAELACHVNNNILYGLASTLTYGARWTGDDCVLSTTIGKGGGQLCYYQRASDQLSFGVEIETSDRVHGSVASFGYQADLPMSAATIRGMLDSNGLVATTFEKKLEDIALNFALSLSLNHVTGEFNLGVGLVLQ